MDYQETVENYLERLASADPTPGGGAASAITGAQATALLEMVCNLSVGKKFERHQQEIQSMLADLKSSRKVFVKLKAEDESAFETLMAGYKLPKNSDDEAAVRLAKIKESLYLAAKAPMKMIEESLRVLPTSSALIRIGNKNLITDVGVAVHLLDATIQSARLNVLINTRLVDNSEFDKKCRKAIKTAENIMEKQKKEVAEVIENFL